MKKRLLSALLALALVFVLLPTTALADTPPETDDNVKINGTAVIVGNGISLGEGNGTYSYDNATHTLTLNNATITTTGNIGISFGVPVKGNIDYKIELIGTNTISSTSAQAIYVEHDTSVEAWEKDTMRRSTLTINGSAGSQLILNASGYEKEAIWSKGDFTLSGGTAVTAFSSDKIAVNVGSMTINNSKLSAKSSSYGTTVVLYGFEMIGDAAEFEALNTSSGVRAVLRTSGASENIDWSKYQLITGSYSGNALTKSEPTVCDKNTLNELFSSSSTTRYIHIAKRTIPALQRTSDVLIAKENAVVGQWTNIPAAATGTGSYYYDAYKKELTLKDVNITHSDGAIVQFMAGAPYIIKLEGTNSIKDVSSFIRVPERGYESLDGLSVTISGAGSLEVIARGNAITMLKGNLIFNNTGAIALETNTLKGKAINVSGNISIGDDFNKNLRITADNGDMTFDPTNQYTDYNDLKNYKSITIAPKSSETYYNDTAMKYGETITGENGGTATVDRENNTITLNNFKGTQALSFDATLADSTLVLEGTSTLSSIVTTQKGLTISGSGSLTVGSIRVTNNDNISADLIITGGAHVTVNGPSGGDEPAVEVSGNLTVTGDGTQLSAECTAATNPAIEVGGNVTISGNPGTNAYTVKAYNKYATQRGRVEGLRPSQMPSAFEISGNLSISGSAQVMAQTDSDGAAVWMPKEKVISVVDASLIAQNRSHNFSTISFGDESNMGNIYAKGQVNIVAENMLGSNSRLAHKAIKAYIYNHYSTGDSNPYYIKVVSEGVQSGDNVNVIPGHCTSTGGYKVTITRGDEVTRTNSPVVIAGTILLNDTYYTITNGSKVAEGTESNYNAFYDSETKTLKLNNAQISHSFAHEDGGGTDGAIIFKEYKNYCIELSGTNTISSMNTYAINGDTNSLTIKNAAGTENAKLTLTGNWTAICSTEGLNIQSDVTMVNTKRADHLMYVNGTFSFDGYNAYASVNASGSPLVEYTVPTSGDKDAGYQYLRITKETLETGGGSTHQHTYGGWKSDATYHWQECTDPNCPDPTKGITNKASHSFSNGACTVCGYRDQTEEHHFGTEWISDEEYHWHKCTDEGCDAISGKAPHEWTGWLVNDDRPEVHAQRCNCGYLGSTHSTLKYVAINGEQHQKQCPVDGCGYKIESSTTAHVYAEGSNICTDCGYNKSAPCDHTGDRAYTNNGDGTHKVTCKACGATIVEKQNHEFGPTGACIYCGATQSGGDPTPDNPGTIVIIRPAEEEKPAQQPNPSTGANDLVGLAVAAAVAAALGSAALLRKHD